MKQEEPSEFDQAVGFERQLQSAKAQSENFKTIPFLHRSLVPLEKVDLSTEEDNGQMSLWNNECEGMCGV
jgi:isopentenyl diphosphate isomerase/L-lactate dehydrogenase-like FMN-dependent dehydrogenase